jgi:hypothetical protein
MDAHVTLNDSTLVDRRANALDQPALRTALGRFCTRIAVITGHDREPLLFYRGGHGGFA